MIISETISLQTKGNTDIIDITSEVTRVVSGSPVKDGTVTIFVKHSTVGITTIEYESGVLADFQEMFQRIIPRDISYQHDRAWGDGNGYSHVRASLLGASLVVPFNNKQLALGTWQQVVMIDFDNRPRSRQVILQIAGE